VRYSLVADTSGHVVANGVMGNIIGMTANLGLLGDNGGPTQTHLLMTGPGVDGGDPASTVMVDQRGFTRPGANSSRDMGAVESDGESPVLNLDFSGDGNYDCADMDLLESAIDAGMPVATFDVNDDGMLSSADVFEWLLDAGELRFGLGRFFKSGDASLDGSVDGSDFGIWNSNKFTTANRWCQGDFNQDDFVDGSDFGVWNSNKFTASDAASALTQGNLRASGANFMEASDDMLEQSADAVPSLALSATSVHRGPKTAGPPINDAAPITNSAQTHPPTMLDAIKAPTTTGEQLRMSFPQDDRSRIVRDVLFSELENW
jgi:hypothetical protein